jgi:3-oxoacyl-[acyl-carrier-protein] synthase II
MTPLFERPNPEHLQARSNPTMSLAPGRVVVTGAGILTALGSGWQENAAGFRAGRQAFRPVRLFDVSGQRAKKAAEIDLPSALPPNALSAKSRRRLSRAGRLLLWAAADAHRQADWPTGSQWSLVLGTTSGGMESGEIYYQRAAAAPPQRRHQPTRVAQYQAQAQALDLLEALNGSGPATLLTNACASGANAIGHAWDLVRSGQADRVLCGGYDTLSQLVFAGFDSLQALSPTVCRPFDLNRDGLALGEGAAILALENPHSAQARGATILAEIAGYGTATDAHHLTQPHPDGDAALQAMTACCHAGGIQVNEVAYINAHGTGTAHNDASEARAIERWAGHSVASIDVSSVKGSIGHLLGGAGAVEAVVCLMVLQENWLPPEPMVEHVDPVCRFRLVRTPSSARPGVVLSNSFGFGGANATLAFRRWM